MVDKYSYEDDYCDPDTDNDYDSDTRDLFGHQEELAALYNDDLDDGEREEWYLFNFSKITNIKHRRIISMQRAILEKKREFEMKNKKIKK
jgi:hypothetical protein